MLQHAQDSVLNLGLEVTESTGNGVMALMRQESSTRPTNIKAHLSLIVYAGCSCDFLTSLAIMGLQMGDMSELG
jgi:hypothetical protein